MGAQARAVVDRLRQEDPEWGHAFDRFGPDSPVEFPDPPVDDRIDPLRPGALDPSGDGGPADPGRVDPGRADPGRVDPGRSDPGSDTGRPPRPGGVW